MTTADTARNLLALAERAIAEPRSNIDGPLMEFESYCSPSAIAALASGYLEAERDAERLAWLGTRSWFMRALTSDDTPLDPARIDELRQVIDAAIERAAIATRGGG